MTEPISLTAIILGAIGAFVSLASMLVKVWLEHRAMADSHERFVSDLKDKLELQRKAIAEHDLKTVNSITASLLESARMCDKGLGVQPVVGQKNSDEPTKP